MSETPNQMFRRYRRAGTAENAALISVATAIGLPVHPLKGDGERDTTKTYVWTLRQINWLMFLVWDYEREIHRGTEPLDVARPSVPIPVVKKVDPRERPPWHFYRVGM